MRTSKMRFNTFECNKNDLIKIKSKIIDADFAVVQKVSKDCIKIVPIVELEGKNFCFPIIIIPIGMVISIERLDKANLLFFTDLKNPHISNAILSNKNKRRNAYV